jgi:hypothetical protein
MAIFMSREGTWPDELANVFTSSLPRADQRPCSTQNEAIGMRPDFGGSSRLTIKVRLAAAVLDLKLVDIAGLAHLDGALRQCLFKRQRRLAGRRFAMDEKDREIFVGHRPRDADRIR